jgi:DNA (cytosine-5)-methyltransferase 1
MTPTLRANMGDNQVAVAIGVDTYNGTESGDIAVTMTAAGGSSTHSGPKVMTNNPIISWDSELNSNTDKMGTLMRGGQGGRMDGVLQNMAVRRLTPLECERLQGFPDNYTNIKDNCPDGHRYKALGNSMAVPVMKWIGQRINELS